MTLNKLPLLLLLLVGWTHGQGHTQSPPLPPTTDQVSTEMKSSPETPSNTEANNEQVVEQQKNGPVLFRSEEEDFIPPPPHYPPSHSSEGMTGIQFPPLLSMWLSNLLPPPGMMGMGGMGMPMMGNQMMNAIPQKQEAPPPKPLETTNIFIILRDAVEKKKDSETKTPSTSSPYGSSSSSSSSSEEDLFREKKGVGNKEKNFYFPENKPTPTLFSLTRQQKANKPSVFLKRNTAKPNRKVRKQNNQEQKIRFLSASNSRKILNNPFASQKRPIPTRKPVLGGKAPSPSYYPFGLREEQNPIYGEFPVGLEQGFFGGDEGMMDYYPQYLDVDFLPSPPMGQFEDELYSGGKTGYYVNPRVYPLTFWEV